MPRGTVFIAGAAGAAILVARLLFGPLPTGGSEPGAPSPSASPSASASPSTSASPSAPPAETVTDTVDFDLPTADGELTSDDMPARPEGTPDWWLPPLEPADPHDQAAVSIAERAVAAYARPAPGTEGRWWPGVEVFLSTQARIDYAFTDPREVGYSTVTGEGQLVALFTHLPTAGVDVPTDTGVYRVVLEPDDRAIDGWAVTSMRPAEAYAMAAS